MHNTTTTPQEKRFIKLTEVMNMTGLSRVTIYTYVNAGKFPAYTKVGRATFWEYHEVQDWMNEKLAERTPK